ncbi:MAG: class I SAM-dependent methyltransferase [Agrococcus casei]|uniref:class I SAM-dependent methyltransferase n=1 Tax=Agrococcus casei TaxID=343512 RepID=UPI003F95E9C7
MTEDHAASLYDAVNTWGADDEYFLKFGAGDGQSRILDLGCGTGRITLAIAQTGARVTGVDPDQPSVAAAQLKPGADRVEWIVGDSRAIPEERMFDAAIMSSNVVQAILDDAELTRTFSDIASHLVPGGRLTFDSRDPNARGWERWTKENSHRVVELPDGESQHWYQTTSVDEPAGLVDFGAHEVDAGGHEHVTADRIRFRSEEHLRSLLGEAGLVVDEVFGGFDRQPVGRGVGTLVYAAHRIRVLDEPQASAA